MKTTMFLVEYVNGNFINASLIDWVDFKGSIIRFTVSGDTETLYNVQEDYCQSFINNLQALNSNIINNIETRFNEINEK